MPRPDQTSKQSALTEFIVTYTQADFEGIERFGIGTVTPKEFLQIIGEKS